MHIPDGFLNIPTIATTSVVSVGAIGLAVKEANRKLQEKHVPVMGILAAFIFAAQMLNFPVAWGTSGHLIGAALAAILLGPWSAIIILSCVVIAQALVFQDGGLLALGANIFNMGILASLSAYVVYRLCLRLAGDSRKGLGISSFIAAWVSVIIASIATALELAFSGVSPLQFVLPAMAGIYALIGIGEGVITVAVLNLVASVRGDLLELQKV